MARKTPIQKEYTYQVARLRRAYNEAIKQGYKFTKTFEQIIKPRKRISPDTIDKLKSIKPKEIRRKAKEYIDTETGEIYNPKKQEKQIRRNIKEKKKQQKPQPKRKEYIPSFVDIALEQFMRTLDSFPTASGARIMKDWLRGLIVDNGREAVARMIEAGYEKGLIITREIVYSEIETLNYMYEMMNYLEDQGKIYRETVINMMVEMEGIEGWETPE